MIELLVAALIQLGTLTTTPADTQTTDANAPTTTTTTAKTTGSDGGTGSWDDGN